MKTLVNLFRWNKELEIVDPRTNKSIGEKVWIRIVGDDGYNEAQKFALIASRNLRKLLKDPSTLDYQSLFADVESKDKEEIVNGSLMADMLNIRDKTISEMDYQKTEDEFLADLDENSTQEQREEAIAGYEVYLAERTRILSEKLEEATNARREELNKLDMSILLKNYMDASREYQCQIEFSNKFTEYCVYLGTYKDPKFKERAFSSFDEFKEISTSLKNTLIQTYTQLLISGDDLKN